MANKEKGKVQQVFIKLWEDYSILFVCLLIIIVCSILAPGFLKWSNFMTILRNCSAIGCIALGMMIGLFNGTIISYFNLPPFIVTLAMQTILRSVVQYITKGSSVAGSRTPFLTLVGNGSIGENFPVPFLIFVGLAIIMHLVMSKTKLGTYIREFLFF